MSKTIHWGIIGPGKIASQFASSFSNIKNAKLYAVASRDSEKARTFARKHNVEKYYGSYIELVEDPMVDVIYIATPHTFHLEHSLLCLNNKKAVLCEKPLTLNAKLATQLIDAAKRNDTFLMEGMWTRFFPTTIKAFELIKNGSIGEVKYMRADFGFHTSFDPSGRLFDVSLGGGAMLDVGVYPLFLSLLLFGRPDEIKAFATLTSTGADEMTTALLSYKNGTVANIFSAVMADTPKTAEIVGTSGMITIQSPWYKASSLALKDNAGKETRFDFSYKGTGFEFEISEVMRCLQDSKKESALMPLDFSLMMAEVSDEIRRQCGIVYSVD
jgi:predicted dehydrogenase